MSIIAFSLLPYLTYQIVKLPQPSISPKDNYTNATNGPEAQQNCLFEDISFVFIIAVDCPK